MKELKSVHMAVDPIRQSLTLGRSCERVSACAEYRDEDRSRRRFARFAVVDLHGIARPIREHLLASPVLLPQHDILIAIPPLV